MAWGFSVSPDELAAVGERLDVVGEDLEQVDAGAVGAPAYMEDLGHEGLAGVVDGFETNWSFRRHELAGEVRRLAELARGAAEAYRETDDNLAASLAPPAPAITGEPDFTG